MSPSPPYRHLLEAPLGSPTPPWIAHLIVGRACAESPSNPKNAMKRIAFEVGFMPWNTPAVTRGQGRSSIMGAVAMLFLMIVTTPSAQAEGSWCATYGGNGEPTAASIPSSNAWRRFPGPADFARRMDSPGIKTIRGRALDVEIR
jgi:hypothetical protein